MKYVLLAYGDEQQLAAMSQSERDAFEGACRSNIEMLRQRGRLLAEGSPQSGHTAATVRIWNGQVSVTADPFTEANDQLMGLFFIEARALNEAIQVAAQLPQTHTGPIEVRPLTSLETG
jgi:hypothetical protein